jgi:hypothetical protein
MSVGLCILKKDTGVALLQDSMDIEGMTIEDFCLWIDKKWDIHSVFLVNDGTEVLDMRKEDKDMLVMNLYNKYEFDLGMSELWIEVKVNNARVALENVTGN